MLGRSLPEYVLIRLSILVLQLVPLLSIAYLCASWRYGHALYSPWLATYAGLETSFYFLLSVPRNSWLQKAATHPPVPSRKEREALFAKCFAQLRGTSFATGWFHFADPKLNKRENLVDWLLWAFFGTRRDGLQEEWAEEIEGYLRNIEQLLGHKIEEGRNHTVHALKVSLDPVVTANRPLLWYVIVALIDTIATTQLYLKGFRHYAPSGAWVCCFPPRPLTVFSNKSTRDGLIYWLRPHRSTTKDPILFFHGIGIGLWPYVSFLQELANADPEVGIIATECLAISMRISPTPLSRPEMLTALTALLNAHSVPRVVVVAHSYGTVHAAHMLRDPTLSARVSAWVFIDPIPFLLHQPSVAYNFVYREPRAANEWAVWYYASRDPDIARTLARHFFWTENILWKEDVAGRDVVVVLSELDQIVDAREVRRYLTDDEADEPKFRWEKDGLQVLWYRGIDHAQVFDTKTRRGPLVRILRSFAERKGWLV
ncbi:hypothetical protein DICSQDRAFT_63022 [Dichomitus squalens LYAD-421 SS1]|uniref:AB hydrolase-1 domain-containing protein n=1 Tax=Dichomitus squalens (strain LYAD-421) TaxID=732165 RepID=R7SW49_DICSQ|nr:uncharacterized protein DICSQDRAFT_63022 [Dichomitus squalens LYAD-421 SS1]EJF60429.1 hypothetical protein DICSQDRAFT_63022 [Dichomitus squalens LYAD-421 SS1]